MNAEWEAGGLWLTNGITSNGQMGAPKHNETHINKNIALAQLLSGGMVKRKQKTKVLKTLSDSLPSMTQRHQE